MSAIIVFRNELVEFIPPLATPEWQALICSDLSGAYYSIQTKESMYTEPRAPEKIGTIKNSNGTRIPRRTECAVGPIGRES
jgi:hypothetical protein